MDGDVLIERAAMSAPLVDAAAIAVFRAAPGIVGPEMRGLIQGAGLTSGAIVIDMAEFVAAGRLDRPLIEVRYRYGEVDGLDGLLAEWEEHGLLSEDGPSAGLVALCGHILDLRHRVAERLWNPATATAVGEATMDAVRFGGGPLLAAGMELPLPATPQARCHHALNLMRWARHGAHAGAWLTRGLTADETVALQHSDHPAARVLIDQIERDTNVWCIPMVSAIGIRFDGWISGLERLSNL